MSGPTIGELFAGAGGIGMGLKSIWPDAQVSWVSDIKPGACKVLAHRFPGALNLGDITAIDWSQVEPVDIITGGSPCQDLSHAGRRMGMKKGTRSGLWASMLTGIDTLRPSLVIWENVRGAYSAEADSALEPCAGCVGDGDDGPVLRALGRVLGDLANIGYDAAWVGLRAADVGAPHGRYRVFVLAWPADAGRVRGEAWRVSTPGEAQSRWSQSVSGERDRALVALPTPRATDGTNGGPNQRGSSGDLMLPSAVAHLPTPPATRGGSNTETFAMLPTPQTSDTNGAGEKPGEWAGRFQLRDIILPRVAVTFGDYAPAIARWESALGRPAPAPVEPTGKGGANRLSGRFTEWMMGWPAGWVTDVPGVTRNEALSICGDGVVPQQCEAAVRWLLDVRETTARAAS